jgi:ADP-ribose pyrophosphatase YjhB (NUDIX family)
LNIRTVVKALVIDNGKLLVNKNISTLGDTWPGFPNGMVHYDLPGGGQNKYETLTEALRRECMEETGYAVAPDRLAAVFEEISMNEAIRRHHERHAHRIYFIYTCRLTGEPKVTPAEKDFDMVESQWVKLEEVRDLPLYPIQVRERLEEIIASDNIIFLGSVKEE